MFTKTLLIVVLLAAPWELKAADEEKFESLQALIRNGVQEFTKATYGSIEKGIDIAKDLVKDLKAYEPKSEADKAALEKLEKYLEIVEKSQGTPVTADDWENKLKEVLRSVVLVGNFKTKEGESVLNSEAVQDLLKKHNFSSVREAFYNDFRIFAEVFTKKVDDFLTYADQNLPIDLDAWIKKFKDEKDIAKKLKQFLELFVIFDVPKDANE